MALSRATAILKRTFRVAKQAKRSVLSDAYECREAWESRLSSPVLRDVDMDEFFTRLEKKFNAKRPVDGVDIDIFANCVVEEDQLDELEHFVYRFRRTPSGVGIFDSTHHAFVRAFLRFHRGDDLLKILFDRVNYGIFPDFYCYNMLMDYFLRRKNYRDATKVAVLVMLQEEFLHPITNRLVLYSCHSYLREPLPEPWILPPAPAGKVETDEEEEEVFVRIPFLVNPYFDDHFDLREPTDLVGKTLSSVGTALGGVAGRTYRLVGLGMRRKWEEASALLDGFASGRKTVAEEGLERFRREVGGCPESTDSSLHGDPERLLAATERVPVWDGDLHASVLQALGEVSGHESDDVAAQLRLFQSWEKRRETELDLQLRRSLDRERKEKIEAKRDELQKREKLLFFFENWNKIEMELEEVKKMPRAAEKTEEYIPPDVRGS
ncbi:small ribosomal subunit protein mS27 [Centruroides vittatus]|uniref:small ribosomal subunit protein mS27 n=1 Tax=Centruroides vittatus TaxID=120091 RepID=UPI00350EC2F3